ncbi:MAG: CotH kinase family protein, partial [Clostridia bacterium]|nr:CotH kinase family protein [Clostridia bacterium]
MRKDLKRWIWLAVISLIIILCAVPAFAEGTVQLNEIMLSSATFEGGKAYEWVELHNPSASVVSVRDWKLTYERKGETQAYVFPSGSKVNGNGYFVLFLTGLDQVDDTAKAHYAPIDVSRKGGTICLYDADGALVDKAELDAQYGDISWGRVANGEEWLYLSESSRGKANTEVGYPARTRRADLSVSGGFFDAAPDLKAMTEEGAVVRYTLDGKEPTADSPLFSEYGGLKKGVTTLRVRAFAEGKLPSETITQTYFVGIDRNVPVVSLVTDEKYLFNEKTGLLVPGSAKRPNYYQDWEYPINVEYYNADHRQEINQQASFRVTGATSRAYAQKAISLFARSALGAGSFEFNPFPNREGYTEYKAVTLRAGGTESYKTRFKDAMLTCLANGTGLFYQESVTCVVYINGQYWGQYNLRERINKDSLAAFEGITDKQTIHDVTIIKGRGEVSRGDIGEWNSLISYMKAHDLRKEEYLNYVLERFDVDNYFTMVAFQVILGNGDIGNQRFYKFPGGK